MARNRSKADYSDIAQEGLRQISDVPVDLTLGDTDTRALQAGLLHTVCDIAYGSTFKAVLMKIGQATAVRVNRFYARL